MCGFEIVSATDYGAVLWNKSSWVWWHSEVPFSLRWNFKKAEGLFAYHGVKGEPKEFQHVVLPSWKWNGKNGLQPVLASNAQLAPEIKANFASVVIANGSLPLPALLLVAMMKHIRYIMFEMFGLQ